MNWYNICQDIKWVNRICAIMGENPGLLCYVLVFILVYSYVPNEKVVLLVCILVVKQVANNHYGNHRMHTVHTSADKQHTLEHIAAAAGRSKSACLAGSANVLVGGGGGAFYTSGCEIENPQLCTLCSRPNMAYKNLITIGYLMLYALKALQDAEISKN